MLRSLFSGISGLRVHQQMLDVTSNNIANVNSVGFKASQSVFEDTLSQMMRSAGAPQNGPAGTLGGTNPAQVGLGVRLSSITTNFLQGSAQSTGRPTDLMISGDGFFVVKSTGEQLFTRAGAFNFDAGGRLVTSTGAAVQGWQGINGSVNTTGQIGDIQMPAGALIAPKATQNGVMSGNLPADATVGTQIMRSIKTYDDQGNAVVMTATFEQLSIAPSSYQVTLSDDAKPTPNTSGPTTLTFVDSTTPPTPGHPIGTLVGPTAVTLGPVTFDIAGLTNYTGNITTNFLSQDGAPAATLQSFNITPDGQLIGVYSNGNKQTVAQIALSTFNNPAGLEKTGDGLFRFTVNSGLPQVGVAGTAGLGVMESGTVEMSNVDLAQEFTNLIVAQRGFQANSKVISTSDELLQDLVNLKR
jgi:flagellar hook protein FlgE